MTKRYVEVKIVVQPAYTSESSFEVTVNQRIKEILDAFPQASISVGTSGDAHGRITATIQYDYKADKSS